MPRSRLLPITVLAVTSAFVVTCAPSAVAAAVPISQSRGFFLAGGVGGTDLANILSLQDAAAVNTGGAAVTSANPLSATVLSQITLPIGQVNLPVPAGLTLGAVNQYAQANPDGSAIGSSGAVADNGAIQTAAAAGPAGSATLDLQNLATNNALPSQLQGLGNVQLLAGALAGRADRAAFTTTGAQGAAAGAYQIGSLRLAVTGPAALQQLIRTLGAGYSAALGPVTTALGTANVTLPDTQQFLAGLTLTTDGLTLEPATGAVTLDVAALLKSVSNIDINALPPNTSLLPLIVQALPTAAASVPALLATAADTFFVNTIGSVAVGGSTVAAVLGAAPFTALAASFATAITPLTTPFSAALTTLGAPLQQLLQLIANGQSTAADGTFTETALTTRVLPDGVPADTAPASAAAPAAVGASGLSGAALQLDLGSALVGSGAPAPAATTPPTTTAPVPAPQANTPTLANTGPTETLGSLALGTWAVVAGLALLLGATAVRRTRLNDAD